MPGTASCYHRNKIPHKVNQNQILLVGFNQPVGITTENCNRSQIRYVMFPADAFQHKL